MGAKGSSSAKVMDVDVTDVEMANYLEEYSILGLTRKDISQILAVFRQVDEQEVGTVSTAKMCSFLGIEKNHFTSLIFSSFDVDLYHLEDTVDFPRFLQAMWNFCTLEEATISTCVFTMYDRDQDSYLNRKAVVKLIAELYGSDFTNCEEARAIQKKVSESRRRHFDSEYFEKLTIEYPPFLYPAFVLQQVLRQKVVGPRFWKTHEKIRTEKYPESLGAKYIPVRVLLMYRTDKKAIKRFVNNREEISAMKVATLRSMSSLKLNRDTSRASSVASDVDGSEFSSGLGSLLEDRGSSKFSHVVENLLVRAKSGIIEEQESGGGSSCPTPMRMVSNSKLDIPSDDESVRQFRPIEVKEGWLDAAQQNASGELGEENKEESSDSPTQGKKSIMDHLISGVESTLVRLGSKEGRASSSSSPLSAKSKKSQRDKYSSPRETDAGSDSDKVVAF